MKLAVVTCSKLPHGVADDQPLLQALNSLGAETHVLAWDADVDWSSFDACLLRSVWDYHERITAFNQWLHQSAKVTQFINPPGVIEWNQNKHYLQDFADFGVDTVPTTWINRAQPFDLAQWCQAQANDLIFFLKPVVGADSSGTLRFSNNAQGIQQAQHHLKQWLPDVDMMLQPYMSQVESFGETSAIYFGGQFSHAVRKIPVQGDYRVQDTFGATDVLHHPSEQELALSQSCLDYLSHHHPGVIYARLDYLHDESGNAYLNEAELIEPSLFFNHNHQAAMSFAQATIKHL